MDDSEKLAKFESVPYNLKLYGSLLLNSIVHAILVGIWFVAQYFINEYIYKQFKLDGIPHSEYIFLKYAIASVLIVPMAINIIKYYIILIKVSIKEIRDIKSF